ncbi:FAD-dependent oxidoreductase [Actinosynnema sp. NPDC051121]|nr:FAD-dependent oxidoreductase [Saccharothrix sp.]
MTDPTGTERVDVAVVGGGVSGLAAAHRLAHRGHSVLVLEREPDLGGRIKTIEVAEHHLDLGAQFVTDFYANFLELARSLGLRDRLVRRSQTAYVVRDGVEHAVWPIKHFRRTAGVSRHGKLRMLRLLPSMLAHWTALDVANLTKCAHLDVTSADRYLRRTVGEEDAKFFFRPILSGLLYWEAETTSYSVVLAVLKAFAGNGGTYRMPCGLRDFTDRLGAAARVRTGATVEAVARSSDSGYDVTYTHAGASCAISARSVLYAVPATEVSGLLPRHGGVDRAFFERVSYSRTAILTYQLSGDPVGYPRGAILFPKPDVPDIASVNPLYDYVDGPAGAGRDRQPLVNVCLSDDGFASHHALDDDELSAVVIQRLATAAPDQRWTADAKLVHVQRWPLALPRFDVGHVRAVSAFLSALPPTSTVDFCGDYLGGPYLDGAITSGLRAADRLSRALGG